ncbi:kinase-like domain-containing protein [Aspergillus coremiiformis]|uniref:Kinase-like domain-containing protein n=1 Tax=Aspergillus coremiiformis TaxID=138285 RepID=A0A5N6YY54_9EURO|nr:kinase-like domain-containing protein [Aspergillus coremiiformis]
MELTQTPSQPAHGADPSPKDFPLDDCDISQVSNETLTALFDTTPALHSFGGTRIVRVSQTLILKGGTSTRPCEANILKLVSEAGEREGSQTIPVPTVHRVFNIETADGFYGCKCLILMDFVDGISLEQCWGDMSHPERVDVVSQVASIINTLRSIPLSQQQQQPGPVGCQCCVARGYWFTDIGAGPLGSKERIESWFNRRLEISQKFHQAPETVPLFHFDKVVLTHLDIAPRNLILGPDGKVWLIDWGDAGIYPDGFEVASLKARRFEAPEYTDMLLEMLSKMLPMHEELYQQLRWITFALTTGQWLGRERLDFGKL